MTANERPSYCAREGEDVCRWVIAGDIDAPEVRRLVAQQKAVMEGAPYFIQLVDMSRVGRVTPEARKVSVEKQRDVNVVGTAIFGASLHVRMIAQLAIKASAVLGYAKAGDTPAQFFATEAEARAWIAARRREVLVQRPSRA